MLKWSSVLLLLAVAPVASGQSGQAKPAKVEVAERASDPRDKVICKRFLETGSLVRGTRVCKTKWDWERQREELRSSTTASNGCKELNGVGGC